MLPEVPISGQQFNTLPSELNVTKKDCGQERGKTPHGRTRPQDKSKRMLCQKEQGPRQYVSNTTIALVTVAELNTGSNMCAAAEE